MRPLTDEDLAMEQLISMVQGNTAPVLDVDELQRCLDDARVAFEWSASEDFSVEPRGIGAVVIPTSANRNGRRYKLVAFDGTGTSSGSAEPSWPAVSLTLPNWVMGFQGIVTDGNLTWREDGPEVQQLWDMNDAASRAWSLKASKTVTCVDFGQDGVRFNAGDVHAHCIAMALFYQPIQFA